MNHRFLLRLTTNVAVVLLVLSCFGIVLWVIDTFLQWDILPDAISLLVQALLVASGIIAAVLVVMNVLLSLALLAEASASRANLPNYGVSARLKRRVRTSIIASIVAIALLIGGLQITNQVRTRVANRSAEADFIQTQADMDESMAEVLTLFTPEILDGLEQGTLAEKGQLGNTVKLFNSIQTSFPHSPALVILTPANQPPYKYSRIDVSSIKANSAGETSLTPVLYTNFPNKQETDVVEQLLAGEISPLSEPLKGAVINNTVPSSWGVLQREGRIFGVTYLVDGRYANFTSTYPESVAPYFVNGLRTPGTFHHDGPDTLLTSQSN
ncbi:MAG: hypothetical protein AAFN12_04010 [Cyanobacteria bacterium J06560_2]